MGRIQICLRRIPKASKPHNYRGAITGNKHVGKFRSWILLLPRYLTHIHTSAFRPGYRRLYCITIQFTITPPWNGHPSPTERLTSMERSPLTNRNIYLHGTITPHQQKSLPPWNGHTSPTESFYVYTSLALKDYYYYDHHTRCCQR
jgi:hypothetical protein